MSLDLKNKNDLFLLFALASVWSRTGPWENAAFFVTYLKFNNIDNPEYWLNEENINNEISNKNLSAQITRKKVSGIDSRKKITFRKDIFPSIHVLAKNWDVNIGPETHVGILVFRRHI